MMTTTGLVIAIAITCLGIYDLYCVLIKGTGSSISNWLINAGFKSPVIVFVFGFLAGHLFGYMSPVPLQKIPETVIKKIQGELRSSAISTATIPVLFWSGSGRLGLGSPLPAVSFSRVP